MKKYIYAVAFALTLVLGTVANATIIWSSCPGGDGLDGICPDEYDVNVCGGTAAEDPLNFCSCMHHINDLNADYVWVGSEEEGTCEDAPR